MSGEKMSITPRIMVPVVQVTESGTDESAGETLSALDQALAELNQLSDEYAAFRAKVAEVASREAVKRNWCSDVYPLLREIGLTEDELPKTHAEVQIIRTYRVPLVRGNGEQFPDFGAMEGIVRNDAYNNGFGPGDVKVIRLVAGKDA